MCDTHISEMGSLMTVSPSSPIRKGILESMLAQWAVQKLKELYDTGRDEALMDRGLQHTWREKRCPHRTVVLCQCLKAPFTITS